MPRTHNPTELIDGVLSGNRLALARAITAVENGAPAAAELLPQLFAHTGSARLIGVTGAPGTGKSTLVTELVSGYRAGEKSVAVLAVDPTSPFTGGALLGDRVRMTRHSGDPGVFIRSMATRGHLGGLAAASADVLVVLDAAGFDRIIIETVGVGQAEVAIAGTAHTTLVIEAPGMGDEVQAIKAGVLEIADLFVVNKAERPGAGRTVAALEMMLEQSRGRPHPMLHHGSLMEVVDGDAAPADEAAWRVPVLRTTATTGDGVAAVLEQLEAHGTWLAQSGEGRRREEQRLAYMLERLVHAELDRRVRAGVARQSLRELVGSIARREMDPYSAAEQILAQL